MHRYKMGQGTLVQAAPDITKIETTRVRPGSKGVVLKRLMPPAFSRDDLYVVKFSNRVLPVVLPDWALTRLGL